MIDDIARLSCSFVLAAQHVRSCLKWLGCRCLGHTSLDGHVHLHGCCGLLFVFRYFYCNFFRTTRLRRKHRLGIPGASVSPPGRPLRPSAQPAGVPLKPGDCAPPRSLAALGPRLCLFRPGAAHLRTVAHHVSAEHGRAARPEAAPLSAPRGTSPRSGPRWFRGKRNGSTARGCASIGLMPRGLCTVRGCASVGPRSNPCTLRAQPPRLGFARTVSPCRTY